MQTYHLIVGILLVSFLGSSVSAQKRLPTWQTKDKKATHEGEFYSLDEKYLTILAPRKIGVDALSRDALRQAHSMEAATFKAGPPQPFTIVEVPPPLNVWKTNDGKTAEGAFHHLDEIEGKLVLLFPKEIEVARLAPESIDLAKQLEKGGRPQKDLVEWKDEIESKHRQNLQALADKKNLEIKAIKEEIIQVKKEQNANFAASIPGNELTLREWKLITRREKILFCANFVYVLMLNEMISASGIKDISNLQQLNRMAETMTDTLDTIAGEAKEKGDIAVHEALSRLAATVGMIKPTIFAGKQFLFSEVAFVETVDATYVHGRVRNIQKDCDRKVFDFKFKNNGAVQEISTVTILNMKQEESKWFVHKIAVKNPESFQLEIDPQ